MRRILFVSFVAVCAIAACSSGGSSSTGTTNTTTKTVSARSYAVGELTASFVRGSRSLPTLIAYPADGSATATAVPTKNAPADRAHGPYPLIVFGHGLGSSGVEYRGLLDHWAAAGFVVAAPQFPLTHDNTPGGVDPGDYVNQPADMSYAVTAVLQASARSDGILSGLVDPKQVGAAGHSLGGITTLGLAANTCCHDARIKAAIVFSGDSETFPGGTFDYTQAPPILFVHGTADAVVPYESSVDAFNLARGPKGLVTVISGDHGATVAATGKAFASIDRITTAFFDAYLKGDTAATARIPAGGVSGVTRVVFAAAVGSRVTVPTTAAPAVAVHHASLTADTGLTNGQVVTAHWSGFTPNKSVNIVECSQRNTLDAGACDLKHAALLQPDPRGTGSGSITIVVGKVGTGTCDASHPMCAIVVNDGGSLDPAASVRIPVTFAGG